MQFVLWHYAKTPTPIARSIFSGTRMEQAISFVKRIFEATNKPVPAELEGILDHLLVINKKRNEILHYGAISIAEGSGSVTNALRALTPGKVKGFPISSEILTDMTEDLRKAILHLHATYMGRPKLKGKHPTLEKILLAPWRYKSPVPMNNLRRKSGNRQKKNGGRPEPEPQQKP